MDYRYCWEDFKPGQVIEHGARTLQAGDIIDFARDWDPQRYHVDPLAAADTPFGGLIASGWQSCGVAMRMMCDAYLLDSASLGSPGVDELRWHRPVHPGDMLSMRMEVLEARLMSSRPGAGLVRSRWAVFNQHHETVMTMVGWGMFGCRPPAATTGTAAPSDSPRPA